MLALLALSARATRATPICEVDYYRDTNTGTCQPCRVCSEQEQTIWECTPYRNTGCLLKGWFDNARASNFVLSKRGRQHVSKEKSNIASQDSRAAHDLVDKQLTVPVILLVVMLSVVSILVVLVTCFCVCAHRKNITWMKVSGHKDLYVVPLTPQERLRVVNTYVKLDQVS